MCVGLPAQILRLNGTNALSLTQYGEEMIDLSLIDPVNEGDWVLTFLGTARAIITEDEAEKIHLALEALASVRNGGDIGRAFEDIISSEPQLPPHLEEARKAGKTIG